MKTQTKQWFLYGTLFAALGFSVSGTDNKLEGHTNLSATLASPTKPSAEAEANLKAKADAIKAGRAKEGATVTPTDTAAAAEAARAEEAAKKTPPTQTQESGSTSTTQTVTPASATVSSPQPLTAPAVATASATVKSRGNGPESTGRASSPPAFEDYTVHVDGHDYKVSIIMANGETRAIYSEKPEGSDCKGECGKEARIEIFPAAEGQNIDKIKTKIREELIPKDITRKKGSKTASNDDDDDKEEVSKGYIFLKAKVHQRCKHLSEGRLETECKAKEFVRLLKADKKKVKKDKDGNKKERFVTDGDAETFFNEEIRDGIKEMLTHKFDIKSVEGTSAFEQRLELEDINSDLLSEKRQAREDRNSAKDLIKSLLRDIDGSYSDTRKAVSALYKESLEEQKRDALESLTARNDYAKAQDYPKAQASLASFLENFGLLRTLNTELYSTTSDSLSFARRNGLIDSDSSREISREMDSFRAAILKEFINNPRILEMGVNSLDSSLTGVTNAARGMRGNVSSGSVSNSGAAALVRQVLSSGSGSRGSRGQ
tara:strand:- start:74056 stop:75690 length:1635 start_codon:yes stop_codon:yes gene_type:complete